MKREGEISMSDVDDANAPINLFEAAAATPREPAANYDTILKIPVTVQVVLGSTSMPVASLMKLGRGAVISLDPRVGEPVNIVVNGRGVARGEVVGVDEDNRRLAARVTEVATCPGARSAS